MQQLLASRMGQKGNRRMTALTAGQLADALGCFWNAALQAAHERQEGGAFASIMVEGIAAVQNRLTEIANANVGIEPTSGQIDLVLLGVDDVVSGRVTDGLDPVRALEAAKDHLKAQIPRGLRRRSQNVASTPAWTRWRPKC